MHLLSRQHLRNVPHGALFSLPLQAFHPLSVSFFRSFEYSQESDLYVKLFMVPERQFRDIRLIFGPGYFEDAFFFFFSFKNKYKFIVKEKKYPIKKFIMSISFSELLQVLLDYEYIFKFNDKFVYIIL